MNILIITHYLPYPLNSGGAQGQFNMTDLLRKKHNITLLFNEGSGNTIENMKKLQALWPEVRIVAYPYIRQLKNWRFLRDKAIRAIRIAFAPKSRQLMMDRQLKPYGQWFSKDQRQFVDRLIGEIRPDIIQVEFYQCLPWANYLPKDIKKVFVHHEIGFIRVERFMQSFELTTQEQQMMQHQKNEEIDNLNKYDHVITVTDIDKQILEQHHVTCPISVSPLAINTSPHDYSPWKGRIVFVGGYNHLPNREGIDWFLREVTPLLPETELDIIGTGWPSNYQGTHGKTRVTLRGFVEDLTDVAYGNIMIVPLLTGSGMRMKILEAAAMSMPVLTTSVGVEGLNFENGESCLIADTAADFADALQRLCHEETLRSSLGRKAREVFDRRYSKDVLTARRDQIYQNL